MATPAYQIAPPAPMNFAKPEEWPKWIRRFERFRQASGLSGKPDADQVNTLIYSMGDVGKDNRPTIFFYLAVAVVGAKISFVKNLSIFKKRETLQIRHKQSNKHVFRVCMHSYMYITKVT